MPKLVPIIRFGASLFLFLVHFTGFAYSQLLQIESGQVVNITQTTYFASQEVFINIGSSPKAHIEMVSQNGNYATMLFVQADKPANEDSYMSRYQTCDMNNCSKTTAAPLSFDVYLSNVVKSQLYLQVVCEAHYPSCCSSYPPCNTNLVVTLE